MGFRYDDDSGNGKWWELMLGWKWPHQGFTIGYDLVEPNDQPQENEEQQGDDKGQPQQDGETQEGDQPGQMPPPGQRMTEEQARQLLAAIANNMETLQEHLGQYLFARQAPPLQDW